MSLQELSEKGGYAYDDWNHTYEKYAKGLLRDDGNPGFATPSGRIELAPYTYRVWGLTPTPFHTEPPEGPVSTPEKMERYPLILSCGGRSFEFFHSEPVSYTHLIRVASRKPGRRCRTSFPMRIRPWRPSWRCSCACRCQGEAEAFHSPK